MFLKTLTLKGFKSFADVTTLDLQPGITVVVGPNGSGKSNVVDAVAWVLGAQGPCMMRSNKMEDVIFAGSSKRARSTRSANGLPIPTPKRSFPPYRCRTRSGNDPDGGSSWRATCPARPARPPVAAFARDAGKPWRAAPRKPPR